MEQKETITNSPFSILTREHRYIKKMIMLISEEIRCIRSGGDVDIAFIETAIEFIETFVHKIHQKKEGILFDQLSKKAISEDDFVLMTELMKEHDLSKIITKELLNVKNIYGKGNKSVQFIISDKLRAFPKAYLRHIEKEETILFPRSKKYFTLEELEMMFAEFRDFDDSVIQKNKELLRSENKRMMQRELLTVEQDDIHKTLRNKMDIKMTE